jgi:serine/threonine protein kinase
MSSGIKGTRNWYAPELLKLMTQFQQSIQTRRGTVKSDVYALGLVFAYLLLNGKHLYGSNEIEIMANIVANKQVNINGKLSTW